MGEQAVERAVQRAGRAVRVAALNRRGDFVDADAVRARMGIVFQALQSGDWWFPALAGEASRSGPFPAESVRNPL